MKYKFLDDIATADIAFLAWGKTREELFSNAAQALLDVAVENSAETVKAEIQRDIDIEAADHEMLPHAFPQKLVYLKDVEGALLRAEKLLFGI